MKYYRCIENYKEPGDYITVGECYREDDCGNERVKRDKWVSIIIFISSASPKIYFEEITQLEYLRSINLKDKLIELANSNKYAIKLQSKKDAVILDSLFFKLNHSLYNKFNNKIGDWYGQGNEQNICFNLNRINFGNEPTFMVITIKELLDYV